MFGKKTSQEILAGFAPRPTTLRVNTLLATREDVTALLRDAGFQLERVPWYADAFMLKNKTKRELTENTAYTDGRIYLQSLASMVPPLALDPKPGETVLDLTAAPGSKTSQIAALMQRQGKLIANDNNKIRFFKLLHNMRQLGVFAPREATPTGDDFLTLRQEDGSRLCRFYPNTFDKILLDAPCSAEARFDTNDPRSFGYWKERKIKEMAYKQRKLLLSAWAALKPGGTLVYSTCTFAPEENELQIARLLERHANAKIIPINLPGLSRLPVLKKWQDKELPAALQNCLRIFPDKKIEGFFVAKIIKT